MKCMALNQQRVHSFVRGGIYKTLVTVMAVVQLVACGGGGGSNASGSDIGNPTSNATASASGTSAQSSTDATASLSLSWVAPVARADGTPLSLADIDGFNIYYGSKAGSYTYRVKITDGTLQRVTLKNLASGTYYIVMTTYDVDGQESGYSTMVKKTAS
jgi:hypothetical protein